MITKAAFASSKHGLRKGASKFNHPVFFLNSTSPPAPAHTMKKRKNKNQGKRRWREEDRNQI